jgi:hypothetical protein
MNDNLNPGTARSVEPGDDEPEPEPSTGVVRKRSLRMTSAIGRRFLPDGGPSRG